jgi:hypothetical protein
MVYISRRAVLGVTGSAALGAIATSPLGGTPAQAAPDGSWTLENDVLRIVLQFTAGSLGITSVYNKTAGQEYQSVAAGGKLFSYSFDGNRTVAADDGGWSLGTPATSAIVMNSRDGQRTIGQQLRLPMTRTSPLPVTVTAVFELYGGRSGLRFYTLIRNDDTKKATIQNSVVLALGFPRRTHVVHYVSVARWRSTTGWLTPVPADTSTQSKRAEMPKKALTVYSDGHGWSLSPEMNWKTQHGKGNYPADYMRPPFAALNIWSGIDHVEVQSNPLALQLTLFPKEEFEYLSVNLTVFSGGAVEGKMADAEHFRKRLRYNRVSTLFNTNDWDWRGGPGRTLPSNYYHTVVIPKAVAAGLDMVMLDDLWNTNRDSTTVANSLKPAIRSMAELASAVTSKGMIFGLWFSLTGGGHNAGRDLADPSNLSFKRGQIEAMIRDYRLSHQMIDLTEFWQNEATTTYSSPRDNVYRKAVLTRRLLNDLVDKNPGYLPKITSELDIYPTQGDRTSGLLHIPYNGWTTSAAGVTGETLSLQTALCLFGHLPMEAAYMNSGRMSGKMEDYYSYMAVRNVKFGQDPGSTTNWPAKGIALMAQFNRWRKSPRVAALTEELFRPVYLGTNWENENWNLTSGPYVWMYTDTARSRALVIATGAGGSATSVNANLRWLDAAATYLVSDITLDDSGSFTYGFKGTFTGAQLRSPGLAVNLKTNTSRGKAFWITKATDTNPQVVYADEGVSSWSAQLSGNDLQVKLSGTANATVSVIVASAGTNRGQVRSATLNGQGTAEVIVKPADLVPPK